MRRRNLTFSFLLLASMAVVISLLIFSYRATSQTRERTVNANRNSESNNQNDAGPAPPSQGEVVKVDVDLVTIDALVLDKKTARGVGDFRLVGLSKRVRGTRFARYDSFVYTPLCLALAAGIVVVATA